jgi:uncharacterized protein YjbJ (UPF0337 family)
MKKNVASQSIGCQMITAADGSAFTSAVTVSVTGDNGAQATGSVGAGACTHEGNGYHSYAPAQAETNYDHVAFTFTGTGAIPATIQIYTTFPQTGDSFARIGVAGAGLTAIDLPDQTMNITGNITGNLSGSVGSVTGAVGSVTGNVGGNVAGSVGSVTGAVGSVTGNVGGNVAGSVASVAAGGIAAASFAAGAVNAAAIAADAGAEIADAILDRDMSTGTDSGSTTVRTVRQALRFLRNKWSIAAGTLTVTKEDDTTSSWTAAVTGTAGADPVTTVDPGGP